MQRLRVHPISTRPWISGLLLLGLVLGGCATKKETVLPQDGPTMSEIYDQHFGELGSRSVEGARTALTERSDANGRARPVKPAELDLAGYTRTAYDEIEVLFPRLPNPTLVMYVFPHLAGPEAVPVPGYSTTFSMYEQVEYALPGEVPLYAQP